MEQEELNGNEYGKMNFGQMLQKHESVMETKEMYLKHHGTLGAKPSNNFNPHMDKDGNCME